MACALKSIKTVQYLVTCLKYCMLQENMFELSEFTFQINMYDLTTPVKQQTTWYFVMEQCDLTGKCVKDIKDARYFRQHRIHSHGVLWRLVSVLKTITSVYILRLKTKLLQQSINQSGTLLWNNVT
jgi:hypothetical protein